MIRLKISNIECKKLKTIIFPLSQTLQLTFAEYFKQIRNIILQMLIPSHHRTFVFRSNLGISLNKTSFLRFHVYMLDHYYISKHPAILKPLNSPLNIKIVAYASRIYIFFHRSLRGHGDCQFFVDS